MTELRPPLGFRIAVVVGAAALVLGLAGALMLALRSEADEPVLGPGAYARVRLVGVPVGVTPQVRVRWVQDDVVVMVPALRLDESPDVWALMPPIPDRGALTVEVTDTAADPPRILEERTVAGESRGELTVDLTVDLGGTPPGD